MPLNEGINTINVSGPILLEIRQRIIEIIRDTTAPTITVLSPSANQSISVPAVVRGSVSDGETGVGIDNILVNGVEALSSKTLAHGMRQMLRSTRLTELIEIFEQTY